MRPLKIQNKYKSTNIDYYINYIDNNKNQYFKLSNNNLSKVIEDIEKTSNYKESEIIVKNFIYFLFRYIQSNQTMPQLLSAEGGKPASGYELINKSGIKDRGIFHIHLSNINNSVLVWYFRIINKKVFIHFEYLDQHPSDDYKQIINDIYTRNDHGYNFEINEYFSNSQYLMKEHLIIKFKNFK